MSKDVLEIKGKYHPVNVYRTGIDRRTGKHVALVVGHTLAYLKPKQARELAAFLNEKADEIEAERRKKC